MIKLPVDNVPDADLWSNLPLNWIHWKIAYLLTILMHIYRESYEHSTPEHFRL